MRKSIESNMARFSLFHWIYTQNGLNLFFALTVAKKDADEKRKILILLFSPAFILKIQKKIHPTLFSGCKKGCKSRNYLIYTLCCGERGIRTPGASQLNGFQDRRNRPLCHLSGHKSRTEFCFDQIFFTLFLKKYHKPLIFSAKK